MRIHRHASGTIELVPSPKERHTASLARIIEAVAELGDIVKGIAGSAQAKAAGIPAVPGKLKIDRIVERIRRRQGRKEGRQRRMR